MLAAEVVVRPILLQRMLFCSELRLVYFLELSDDQRSLSEGCFNLNTIRECKFEIMLRQTELQVATWECEINELRITQPNLITMAA